MQVLRNAFHARANGYADAAAAGPRDLPPADHAADSRSLSIDVTFQHAPPAAAHDAAQSSHPARRGGQVGEQRFVATVP